MIDAEILQECTRKYFRQNQNDLDEAFQAIDKKQNGRILILIEG
jgi:Ca2+-binding EF-hand superfamily protein